MPYEFLYLFIQEIFTTITIYSWEEKVSAVLELKLVGHVNTQEIHKDGLKSMTSHHLHKGDRTGNWWGGTGGQGKPLLTEPLN
jgi:hypothetical protein